MKAAAGPVADTAPALLISGYVPFYSVELEHRYGGRHVGDSVPCMDDTLGEVEQRLDAVVTTLLPPLRSTKQLEPTALAGLLAVGDDLAAAVQSLAQVPKRLVGTCLFVFTAMLTEAEHAPDGEPILDAAWEWQERMRRAFGPHF